MSYKLLNRISFGATPNTLKKLQNLGFEQYIEEQLSPSEDDNERLNNLLENFIFKGDEPSELIGRGFHYIDASISELWEITKSEKNLEKKGLIPAAEVVASSCLKATYSDWQLREVLVHFWHNHFNVSVEANQQVSVTLPLYDKHVIRKHCLGNFRDFLEAVAKSQSMLFYLNNASSRASPANENYARELFELHTLGEDNYMNHLYNRWREVPGATEGKATGYIDEDIYEAARAFTGWTVAEGEWTEEGEKPNTGEFLYLEKWHDNYQKRIMGVEFRPNQAPLADGQKVLDMLAQHKGTATFLCTKLCIRFISDNPPQDIIDKVVKVWLDNIDSKDQIKLVVKTILLSEEFKASLGGKIKNPFELLISMFRTLDLDFSPNMNTQWLLQQMGYKLFTWPTPTGHPDKAAYWLNSNMMLKRWNLMPAILFDDWHQMIHLKVDALIPETVKSSKEIVFHWVEKILGKEHQLSKEHQQKLINTLLVEGKTENDPPITYGKEDKRYRFAHILSLIFMSPAFQYR